LAEEPALKERPGKALHGKMARLNSVAFQSTAPFTRIYQGWANIESSCRSAARIGTVKIANCFEPKTEN